MANKDIRFLTIPQVSRETGWPVHRVRRWIDTGVLPARRRVTGRRVTVDVPETSVAALKGFFAALNDLGRRWEA